MRYIDADKVLYNLSDDLPYKASVRRVLIQADEADVVEVRHGEWLLDGRCSECLENPLTTHKTYCPNCGALMDGKGKNELFENFEQLVKTNDILIRDGKQYEVVIADDNIFVICLMEYDNLEGSWITHYDAPEIYANQSSINTLKGLKFAKMDEGVTE